MSGHDMDYVDDYGNKKPVYPTKKQVQERNSELSEEVKGRVISEQIVLKSNLVKLREFTESRKFSTLSIGSRDLLLEQCRVMQRYSMILDQRIDLF